MDVNIAKLFEAIRTGGRRGEVAFSEIYDILYPKLSDSLHFKYNINNEFDKDNIIQETLIAVYTAIKKNKIKHEHIGSLINFSRTTLHYKTLDFIKDQKNQPSLVGDAIDEYVSEISIENTNIDPCYGKALDAFSKNNPKGYEILSSYFESDMSLKELAKIENRKYGAMRQYISAIRKKLKKLIDDYCL